MRSRRIEVPYEMYTIVRRYEKVSEDFLVDNRQGKEKNMLLAFNQTIRGLTKLWESKIIHLLTTKCE
jgi:hypothetical protein